VTAFICKTCGVQHAPSDGPPEVCLICNDERQYVGWAGQEWSFAIGQRALLVQTPTGNFLWDAISYIDDETIGRIRELGGLNGISTSHPHFYGAMIEWSQAFGGVPVLVPKADEEWIARPDAAVSLYEDSVEPLPGVTLVRCGGHFDGSAVLHWEAGAGGRGALLTGDSISVVADRRWVTFMRSYPNYIPLAATAVRGIVGAVSPYSFDRVYGGWWQSDIKGGGKEAVERSAERYIRRIGVK
jgi:hypothetical protein